MNFLDSNMYLTKPYKSMTITFHGAARTVTGSKHLLQLQDGTSILLDCGMFQGMGEHTEDLNEHFGFNPKKVDYLILSHAHIDHCGLIPRFVAEGFNGTIFCTPPTFDQIGRASCRERV